MYIRPSLDRGVTREEHIFCNMSYSVLPFGVFFGRTSLQQGYCFRTRRWKMTSRFSEIWVQISVPFLLSIHGLFALESLELTLSSCRKWLRRFFIVLNQYLCGSLVPCSRPRRARCIKGVLKKQKTNYIKKRHSYTAKRATD